MGSDQGPSGSQFIALRTRVPVEVVRPRSKPGLKPSHHFSPGPMRNYAVGGRDLMAELNTWLASLSERPTKIHENEPAPPRQRAGPIRAVMPPPLAHTIHDARESWVAAGSDDTIRDPITGRALAAPTGALTA